MGQIIVSSVVRRIAEQGFNVAGTLVSYYHPIEEMYIFIGKDPIPPEKDGVGQDCLQKNRLTLRFRSADDTPKGNPPAPEMVQQPPPMQGKPI